MTTTTTTTERDPNVTHDQAETLALFEEMIRTAESHFEVRAITYEQDPTNRAARRERQMAARMVSVLVSEKYYYLGYVEATNR